MGEQIRVLSIGQTNPKITIQDIPENIEWIHIAPENVFLYITHVKQEAELEKKPVRRFSAIVIECIKDVKNIDCLDDFIEPYRVFYMSEGYLLSVEQKLFMKRKLAKKCSLRHLPEKLELISKAFYERQSYGDKFHIEQIMISPNVRGKVRYTGHNNVSLSVKDIDDFQEVAIWKYNYLHGNKPFTFWLEYQADKQLEVQLVIHAIKYGSVADIMNRYVYSQKDMETPITLDEQGFVNLCFSLQVRGSGTIHIGALHKRDSRFFEGDFFVGGQTFRDSKREEFHYYFHPGDLTPPLNVYFSGFKGVEGFEGYRMMQRLGAPFLLISDSRLTGGAFYLGSEEFEKGIVNVIRDSLDWLGFTNDQLVLSGLSMGTFGALYYGAKLLPHTILVGKPLVNLGDVAFNELMHRPGVFPTSLDLLQKITGKNSKQTIDALNQRFWQVFDEADFEKTSFVLSYMKNDDYDMNAYHDILNHLKDSRARIISKGIAGRHNDNTNAILEWFRNQYEDVLKLDFKRSRK
ncbi:accessory Sec system protein Asp2 [Granulicatella sp. zg-ZJ]|uniref:accessory Sec system protein Asp2 n=1 Tax=Granulicatella sp. zg-ZJ TaxID=2678504 RepID=UPI0013D4A6FA|nr:accessory Sec system protein Asp2 [Granulicatella sp. zg-ZJ]NEW63223.1 accessory Sec system protein Asp2 [Granulicatella sp. zg-ZJ]